MCPLRSVDERFYRGIKTTEINCEATKTAELLNLTPCRVVEIH